MTNQMTERFSAPGATLVKLFGRPDDEVAEFADRAVRIRDIGVRTAMVSRVFVTALSLVSALAQALIYGLGGWLAVTGRIEAGTDRHPGAAAHPALHADDRARERPRRRHDRAGVVRAGLRGARPPADDHRAAGRPRAARRAGRRAAARRAVHLPARRPGVAGLAGGGRRARPARRRGGAARHRPRGRPGRAARARRPVRGGQVDDRLAGPAALRRRRAAPSSWPASTCAT